MSSEVSTMYKYLLGFLLLGISCSNDIGMISEPAEPTIVEAPYFPATNNDDWETITPETLEWDQSKLEELYDLLETNGTRAFIIAKNGRIIVEEYFGENLIGGELFNKESMWYWASAGKCLTSVVVGKAQEDGYLKIDDRTNQYLGESWTSLSSAQENLITIRNQLTMTSGLDDAVDNSDEFYPENLSYKSDAGTRWAYHNAPYTLLDEVVTDAVQIDFDTYFQNILADPIGMNGTWRWLGSNHVYFSTARDMARFGLLLLNKGTWQNEKILEDQDYIDAMVTPSQDLNESYGYLFWLNGQSSYMLPGSQIVFDDSLVPNAPTDMYCGLGKNGQYICVIPSQDMVMIRVGENPDQALVPLLFLDDIWNLLAPIVNF